GDSDSNGIASASPISLNGGTMKDGAGNDAALAFTPPNTAGVLVDTTAPTLSSVTAPADGTYIIGQTLTYTASFSENVTVSGTPFIALTIGATTRNANYLSGSGTSVLLFRYTVVSGDNDGNGITSTSPINLNGGTIKDVAGNAPSSLAFTPPNTTGVLVDGVAPAISSVTAPPNGSYRAGQNLDFTVNYNDNVTVNLSGGTPSLSLTIGSTSRSATYVSGTGTAALLFRYTIQAGDADATGIASASPLVLNGATMKDAAGNNAGLTFTAPNTTS